MCEDFYLLLYNYVGINLYVFDSWNMNGFI